MLLAAPLSVLSVGGVCLLGRHRSGGEGVAPGVTAEAIRAMRLEMSEDEVYRIIGPPFFTYPTSYGSRRITLQYTRRVLGARWYPMLWVHLEDGRVVDVYAKKYVRWGTDDLAVYMFHGGVPVGGEHLELTFRPPTPGVRCGGWLHRASW